MTKNNNYDCAIFQFDANEYFKDEVKDFSRTECEELCNTDEDNVTKFDLGACPSKEIEALLNEEMFDTSNCFYRVFIG